MTAIIRTSLVLAVLASGCMKRSATYCAKHGADDPDSCPPIDAPGTSSCKSDTDCASSPSTLVCNTDTEVCVECVTGTAKDDACVDDEPFCGVDNTCRACESHAECPSEACLPDGRCGTDANVAYVAQSGMGTTCTYNAPCAKIADALAVAPRRDYIKISGTIDETVVISNRNVTLLAAPDAQLVHAGGTLLQVAGTSNVTVFDLQIGAATTVAAIGVDLANGLVGTVSLQRVRVVNTSSYAVVANGGTLELERSRIIANPGGGVVVRYTATDFRVRNNFIVFNGRASGPGPSAYGGVLLEKDSATSTFVFNTIAYNQSTGMLSAAGVECLGPLLPAGGNLIYANREGDNLANLAAQYDGSCDLDNSFVAASGDLGFEGPMTSMFDPHLTTASPTTVRDAGGDCGSRVLVDIDGDARPAGGPCDLGADELAP